MVFDMGGGATVQLDAKDYSRPAPARMLREGAVESEIFCRSSLLPVDMKEPLGPNVFIWGEPVLRRYYTAYDWGSKRIGFGAARPEGGAHVSVLRGVTPRFSSSAERAPWPLGA